jgi:hypothetical protein
MINIVCTIIRPFQVPVYFSIIVYSHFDPESATPLQMTDYLPSYLMILQRFIFDLISCLNEIFL